MKPTPCEDLKPCHHPVVQITCEGNSLCCFRCGNFFDRRPSPSVESAADAFDGDGLRTEWALGEADKNKGERHDDLALRILATAYRRLRSESAGKGAVEALKDAVETMKRMSRDINEAQDRLKVAYLERNDKLHKRGLGILDTVKRPMETTKGYYAALEALPQEKP